MADANSKRLVMIGIRRKGEKKFKTRLAEPSSAYQKALADHHKEKMVSILTNTKLESATLSSH